MLCLALLGVNCDRPSLYTLTFRCTRMIQFQNGACRFFANEAARCRRTLEQVGSEEKLCSTCSLTLL